MVGLEDLETIEAVTTDLALVTDFKVVGEALIDSAGSTEVHEDASPGKIQKPLIRIGVDVSNVTNLVISRGTARTDNNRQYNNRGNYQNRRPFPNSGQYVHFDNDVHVHRYPPSSPPDQRLHDYGARNTIHSENYSPYDSQEDVFLRYPELDLRENCGDWDNSARLAVIHGSEELN